MYGLPPLWVLGLRVLLLDLEISGFIGSASRLLHSGLMSCLCVLSFSFFCCDTRAKFLNPIPEER